MLGDTSVIFFFLVFTLLEQQRTNKDFTCHITIYVLTGGGRYYGYITAIHIMFCTIMTSIYVYDRIIKMMCFCVAVIPRRERAWLLIELESHPVTDTNFFLANSNSKLKNNQSTPTAIFDLKSWHTSSCLHVHELTLMSEGTGDGVSVSTFVSVIPLDRDFATFSSLVSQNKAGYFWRDIETISSRICSDRTRWAKNVISSFPYTQTLSTALSQHKMENWIGRQAKLQHIKRQVLTYLDIWVAEIYPANYYYADFAVY